MSLQYIKVPHKEKYCGIEVIILFSYFFNISMGLTIIVKVSMCLPFLNRTRSYHSTFKSLNITDSLFSPLRTSKRSSLISFTLSISTSLKMIRPLVGVSLNTLTITLLPTVRFSVFVALHTNLHRRLHNRQ